MYIYKYIYVYDFICYVLYLNCLIFVCVNIIHTYLQLFMHTSGCIHLYVIFLYNICIYMHISEGH